MLKYKTYNPKEKSKVSWIGFCLFNKPHSCLEAHCLQYCFKISGTLTGSRIPDSLCINIVISYSIVIREYMS